MTPQSVVTLMQASEVLAAHLAVHQLPEPYSLEVTATLGRTKVTACVHPITMPGLAAELLAWADTLSTLTIKAWRTPDGHRVLLSLGSTLPGPSGAVALDVYGAVDYDPVLFADLAPGEKRPRSVGELRELAVRVPRAACGGEMA
jgi:hypothetical protein